MKSKWCKVVVLLLALGVAGSAVAVSWTGAGSDDLWTNGDNWDTGVAPSESDTLGNTIFISGSANNVLIDSDVTVVNDILGPEWGATVTIDGGSLHQVTTGEPDYFGWRLAPVSNILYDPPSVINVLNGGNLSTESNLCIGENWWWSDGYYVNMNVYDTSTVTASGWAFLGGQLNLYGGTVDFAGLNFTTGNGYAGIDIENGTLIIRDDGLTTATVQGWEDGGFLTGFGGSGDVLIDDTSGDLVITAVIPEPATIAVLGIGAAALLRKRK
jgi:hypothetical protein